MSIPEFITRCDAYASNAGITRATLSNKLFGSHRKLDELAGDKVDIGVKRLERAIEDLSKLEADGGDEAQPQVAEATAL